MKRILFIAVIMAVCTMGAFAQTRTIQGKWKLIALSAPDFNFDAQNPGQLRKDFIKKFEASGVKADSAMIDEIVNPIIESLGSMIFEFTPNGKLISSESSGGKIKKEEEDYTVNYDKGTIDSKSTHSVQHMKFSFDKEHLILVIVEDNKEGKITLKKIQ